VVIEVDVYVNRNGDCKRGARRRWAGSDRRGATVLPGATIGGSAVAAAGAVVSRDVSTDKLVVGLPARVLKRVD